MLTRRTLLPLVAAAALAALAGTARHARGDKPGLPPTTHPWYVDDTKYLDDLTAKLTKLAEAGKCLPPDAVAKKIATDGTCAVAPAPAGDKPLAPEEVYKQALPGVFVVGCVLKPEKEGEEYTQGWFATAWVLAADGVLVTNWHVFDNPTRAYFGAADARGAVFPLTDILAVNKKADVAVVRVGGKGFTPLPVAAEPAEVGSWVGVLSHPGHQWFTFTQGHVTRYTKNFGGTPETKGERWMGVTADYAGGSSGGPVLNRFGAVVGMAALTSNIDFDGEDPPPAGDEKKEPGPGDGGKKEKDPKPADKPRPNPDEVQKPKPPEKDPKGDEKPAPPADSRVQMIVKLTVPAGQIRKVIGAPPVHPNTAPPRPTR